MTTAEELNAKQGYRSHTMNHVLSIVYVLTSAIMSTVRVQSCSKSRSVVTTAGKKED